MSNQATLRAHIRTVVLDRISREDERRKEALYEFLAVSFPDMPAERAERVANLIPPVMAGMYEKWIAMFTDRLFETVPENQLEHLCNGSEENNASLVLVYLMYLESATMEKQIDQDLRAYGREHSEGDDLGDAAAAYLRASMAAIAGSSAGKKG